MDADQPLKVLFQTRPRDLLPLTGDRGARVLSAGVLQVPAAKRDVDLVLLLERRGEQYVRHVEFEARYRRSLALRCFEYATRLVVRLRQPVLTTVVFLRSGPRDLAFRECLGGKVVHERRFDVVRLGDVDVATALALGPGGAALVGLARGVDLDVIGRASREIQRRAPPSQQPDLLAILQCLSEGRYTASQLARVIPEEVAMHSSLFEKAEERGVAKGLAKGVAKGMVLGVRKGRIEQARRVCAAFVMRHHPEAAPRVLPAIEACSSLARLDRWTLRVPEISGDELVRLVTAPASSRSGARRAPRPARRARRDAAR